jgi:hypothetical protein
MLIVHTQLCVLHVVQYQNMHMHTKFKHVDHHFHFSHSHILKYLKKRVHKSLHNRWYTCGDFELFLLK